MPVSINGTTGLIDANITGTVTGNLAGNVTGNVTGNLTGTASNASAVTNGSIVAEDLNGNQTGSAPIYGCRAWVRFNGTTGGTNVAQTIIGQGNVASVTRIGTDTGRFLITFTTPMPDTNYCIIANYNDANTNAANQNDGQASCYDPQLTTVRLTVVNGAATLRDPQICSVVVFG